MFEKESTYIIGYSLDAVLLARELASKGKKVTFLQTGKLGYPLDEIRDYISYEDMLRVKSMHINVPFRKLVNSTYAFIPYEQVKFVNNQNGLMSWPINRSSIDSAEEWEQMEACISGIGEFREKLDKATNYINIYKNFFPKWLYDTIIKHVAISKWGGFRQSKFSEEGLAREINLSCLDDKSTGVVYTPTNGYKDLCNNALDHENITISSIKLSSIRKFLSKRFMGIDVILMDNRVDEIFGYLYGAFDRVKWHVEESNEQNLEEFIDVSSGVIFTPTKDYWCISNDRGNITKITTELIDNMNTGTISQICHTSANKKMYSEYKKLVKLHSGKILTLKPMTQTVIM